jgi:hypothetical protein
VLLWAGGCTPERPHVTRETAVRCRDGGRGSEADQLSPAVGTGLGAAGVTQLTDMADVRRQEPAVAVRNPPNVVVASMWRWRLAITSPGQRSWPSP